MTLPALDAAAVEALGETMLDERIKGIPPGAAFPLRELPSRHPHVRNLFLPVLVAREAALAQNIAAMQRFCDERGMALAPHGKTSMSPQLFLRQIRAGAWGITAATAQQFALYRRFGVRRCILANQIAGENLRYVARELARDVDLELFVYADSPQGVRALAQAARDYALPRPFEVLLELGYRGGRTGVRSEAEALALADDVRAHAPFLTLAGVAGFEGLLANEPAGFPQAQAFLRSMRATAELLHARGNLPPGYVVTAGGSSGFELVAEAFAGMAGVPRVILRSGCYVSHDHGQYDAVPAAHARFRPALELWSYVQSRPEPDLLYLNFGRRDAPFDAGYPRPFAAIVNGERESVAGWRIEALNDQHARVRIPRDARANPGDGAICGISHPCGAFDRWKLIPVLDERDAVVDALLTFF